MPTETEILRTEVHEPRMELERIRKHNFFRAHTRWYRMMYFYFLRGVAMGLGTVIGATVLLSVMLWLLAQVEFLPIVGKWATEIARMVEAGT